MNTLKGLVTVLIGLSLLLTFQQCEDNVFSFSAPDKGEATLIEEGRALLNDGEYEKALEKFTKALEEDPSSTAARFYHAKATLHSSGFNAIVLSRKLASAQNGQSLPFMDMRRDSSNVLYQTNNIIIRDLKPIADGTYTGRFTRDDVNLDLTLATTTSGILSFKDTNNDGTINSQDIDLSVIFDPNGDVSIGDLDSLQNDPDAINTMIDNVDSLISNAGSLITDLLGDSTSGVDTEAIDQMIQDISETAGYYYVNDGIDNDGDGQIDEECLDGVDNDSDGLTDEDANTSNICP